MTQEDILANPQDYDLSIETVGKGTLKSPMKGIKFVSEDDRLEAAGPRETIFHDPAWTRAGIVTCGGL